MNIISNNTELIVIFERINQENLTIFYPTAIALGKVNKEKHVFVTENGEEYPYIFDTTQQYGFALRNKVGNINKTYKEKRIDKLLKRHLKGLQRFIFYFANVKNKGLEFVCEDEKGNIYILEDRDFNAYKKYQLNKDKDTSNQSIKINSKELIGEVKKKIIGQDSAIEDIVSIIWQNSKCERKQNILLIGPTGVGKTEITRIIAKKLNIPIVTANAASLTQSGYKGESVEDILKELITLCHNDIKKAEHAMIIIDEIDKLVGSIYASNDVATTGVQDELLKLIEDGTYLINMSNDLLTIDNVVLNTKDITFIGIGAFSELVAKKRTKTNNKQLIGFNNSIVATKENNEKITETDLSNYGLKPELVGRFSSIIELNSLTKDNLIQIMKNPNEDLIKEKIEILKNEGVKVEITDSVYEKLANIAIEKNTGARGLISAVDKLFVKAISEVSLNEGKYEKLKIDEKTIEDPKKFTLIKRKNK